jgi:hypothetical protein
MLDARIPNETATFQWARAATAGFQTATAMRGANGPEGFAQILSSVALRWSRGGVQITSKARLGIPLFPAAWWDAMRPT